MRAKEYNLIAKCVETGVMFGWSRAHKHTDEPDPEAVRNAIEHAVMNEICEWFNFEDSISDENT